MATEREVASTRNPPEVGIRELRDHLSRYLAQVRQGGEIVATKRGQPVARFVPVGGERTMDRLIREGLVTPPEHPGHRDLPPPVEAGE